MEMKWYILALLWLAIIVISAIVLLSLTDLVLMNTGCDCILWTMYNK